MDDASSRGGQASSDAGQVFVMNPGPGFGNGLIFIQNSFLYGGGIRAYANAGGGEGIYVANILQEAGYAPPVEMVGCPHTSTVSNIQIADALTSFAGFRVDNASSCASGNLAMAQETSVDGPAILMGAASPPSSSVLPETMGQYGIVNGKVYAQADTPRRGFGPIAARFPNLARQVASTWNTGGCPTAIAGVAVAAPDGTTNAGAVSHGADATACFYGGTQKLNAGDTFLMGVWARSASGNGFARGTVFQLACDHCTFNGAGGYVQPGPNLGGAGEWDWVWLAARVTASNGSDIMHFQGTVNSSHKADFFAPVLIRIPAGTLTANEIGEMALHLQSYRDDAEVWQVSLLRGEQFKADSIQVGDGPTITSGAGPPKSPASPGCIYLRRDGAPGSTFYIYEKGGWKAQF
jgi:hypothetical protein